MSAREFDLDAIRDRLAHSLPFAYVKFRHYAQMDDDLHALVAEVERLRAGGCARDQGFTQFCAEAAVFSQRCEVLNQKVDGLEREVERLRTKLETERASQPYTVPLAED